MKVGVGHLDLDLVAGLQLRRGGGTGPGRWCGGRRTRWSRPGRGTASRDSGPAPSGGSRCRCPGRRPRRGRCPGSAIRPIASPVWTRFANRSASISTFRADVLDVRDPAQVGRGRELALQVGQLVLGLVLLDRAVDARDRLLPGERRRDVGEHHEPGGDQRHGEDAKHAAHRPDDGGPASAHGASASRARVRDLATSMTEPPDPADRLLRGRPRARSAASCCSTRAASTRP